MSKDRPSLSYEKSLKEKAREMRNNPTAAEKLFWHTLRKMPFYSEFTFNRQKPLGHYIVDVYCHQFRLVIEIDGDTHAERADYDLRRTAYLESLGISVLRFTNPEVLSSIEGVMMLLTEKLCERGYKSPCPPLKRG